MKAKVTIQTLGLNESFHCPYTGLLLVTSDPSGLPSISSKNFILSKATGLFYSEGGWINVIDENLTFGEALEVYNKWLKYIEVEDVEVDFQEHLEGYSFNRETHAIIINDEDDWGHYLIILQP